MPHAWVDVVALAGLSALGGCDRPCQTDLECPAPHVCSSGHCTDVPDAGRDSAPDRVDRSDADDAAADPELPDAGWDSGPGVRATLVTGWTVTDELLCDLDGDGLEDNVLGTAHPRVLSLMESAFAAALDVRGNGVLFDLHLAGDATHGSSSFEGAIVAAADCDDDPADNPFGGEVFDALVGSYDSETLEPDSPISMTVTAGELRGSFEVVRIPTKGFGTPWIWRGGRLEATVVDGFRRLEDGTVCTYYRACELAPLVLDPEWDRTALDVVVAPGAVLGIPDLPGLQPDIDLDGDGLETFVADAEGRVVGCFDGDGTQVSAEAGVACPLAPEIADAISMTLHFEAVWARLLIPGGGGADCPPLHDGG